MRKSEIKEILKQMNFTPSKFRGQSFLLDKNIAKRIVDALEIVPGDKIIEIGAGLGILTGYLSSKDVIVYGVEIEKDFCNYLKQIFPDVQLINQDFLKIEEFPEFNKIIGNIPYIKTSEILYRILDFAPPPKLIILTLQKEVGKRLVSKPGNKNYSALSVLFQTFFECEYLFTIAPKAFYPEPEILSGVIKMRRKERIEELTSKNDYIKFVKQLFKQRRKTIKNNLVYAGYNGGKIEEILHKNNIPPKARPESLTYKEIIMLYEHFRGQSLKSKLFKL